MFSEVVRTLFWCDYRLYVELMVFHNNTMIGIHRIILR